MPELEERPMLEPWCNGWWRAWCHLTASRRMGFGAGPVPVSEVKAYIDLRYPDWSIDERLDFLEIVSRLDEVYFRVTKETKPPVESNDNGEK